VSGAYFAVAGLLIFAGLAKLWRPTNTAIALRRAGLPVGENVVRLGALVEAFVGGWALTGSAIASVLMAASYLTFAAFVALALRTGSPISSCGCFGEPDTPPTVLHLLINLGAASAALGGRAHLGDVLSRQPMAGVPFVVLVVTIGYLAYLIVAVFPKVAR
jgi:hypothetical protein